MRALVVYESMYGNTQLIAAAIGKGLATELQVDLLEADSAPSSTDGYDIFLVGGPTHAFSMSTKQSRGDTMAKADRELVSQGSGIRDWIGSIAPHRDRTQFATFDTRYDKPTWITGSAARRAAGKLQKRGFTQISPAMSFFITKAEGPLADDEEHRAFEWGERLAVRLVMTG
jgi:flavodoxin